MLTYIETEEDKLICFLDKWWWSPRGETLWWSDLLDSDRSHPQWQWRKKPRLCSQYRCQVIIHKLQKSLKSLFNIYLSKMIKFVLVSVLYCSVFQPFSSRGTFETLLNLWRNLDTKNCANLRILILCFSLNPVQNWRNLWVPQNPGWKTLLYCIDTVTLIFLLGC